MFKKSFHPLKLYLKFILIYFLLICIIAGLFTYFYVDLTTYLTTNYFIDSKIILLLKTLILKMIIISFLLILPLLLILYIDIKFFLNKINNSLKDSLSERKLESNFTNLYSGKTFSTITTNIISIFSLFKSFDNLKAAQISIEMNSLKSIINNIHEGIILINKEKIVTHINHPAETIFRLIPGEILNQIISRKISNPVILENLDKVFEEDIKINDLETTLKGGKTILLNILPIKNKFNETTRAMIIFEEIQIELQQQAEVITQTQTPTPTIAQTSISNNKTSKIISPKKDTPQ
jgi:transcriptional regulator with PAS, ATPase and Fis domain